jgi:hypothetical protein
MIRRALLVWGAMLVAASVNGALREALLIETLGDVAGRALSTVVLAALVLLLTCVTLRWIGARTPRDAWTVGLLWLALTLAFEFLAGRYLFGRPWGALLEDYDVTRGRIWILALLTTVAAPRLCLQRGRERDRERNHDAEPR